MPPALTPALALDYVRELSADVRAGVVVGASGDVLAGPPELGAPARAFLTAAGNASEAEAVCSEGVVCAVRAGNRAAVAVCGRFALAGVVRHDLRVALAGIAGAPPAPAGALVSAAGSDALEAAASALLSAVQRGSRGSPGLPRRRRKVRN